MNELFFVGIDIVEETRNIVNTATSICADGMTDNELKAYNLGVKNTLSALKGVICVDAVNELVLNIDGLEVPTEFTIEDLETYLLDA